MNSLEKKIFAYLLDYEDKSRIHLSEINKSISAPPDQLKKEISRLTKTFPNLGIFYYSTGWIERKIVPKNISPQKRITYLIFIIGAALSIGLGAIGSFIGYGLWFLGLIIMSYAIVHYLDLIHYDETRREVVRIRSLYKHYLRLQ
ncbi:MAG: hypothetical protein ACFFC7_10850 [Candidatus Hermodarchaeota archaeon]